MWKSAKELRATTGGKDGKDGPDPLDLVRSKFVAGPYDLGEQLSLGQTRSRRLQRQTRARHGCRRGCRRGPLQPCRWTALTAALASRAGGYRLAAVPTADRPTRLHRRLPSPAANAPHLRAFAQATARCSSFRGLDDFIGPPNPNIREALIHEHTTCKASHALPATARVHTAPNHTPRPFTPRPITSRPFTPRPFTPHPFTPRLFIPRPCGPSANAPRRLERTGAFRLGVGPLCGYWSLLEGLHQNQIKQINQPTKLTNRINQPN